MYTLFLKNVVKYKLKKNTRNNYNIFNSIYDIFRMLLLCSIQCKSRSIATII